LYKRQRTAVWRTTVRRTALTRAARGVPKKYNHNHSGGKEYSSMEDSWRAAATSVSRKSVRRTSARRHQGQQL